MKYLVVNADDFGWDYDTVEATIDLFEKEVITSASIMTGRPATEIALNYARKNQHRFSFGLHFNIVDGHIPLSRSKTLTDNSGKFLPSRQQLIKALTFRLNPTEILTEFNYQMQVLKGNGIKVSHVDSHGNLHKYPNIILSIKKAIQQYDLNHVRIPQNIYEKASIIKNIYNLVFKSCFSGLPTSQFFFMLKTNNNPFWLNELIKKLPSGITELGIHPGNNEPWRQFETSPFLADDYKSLLSLNNVRLINFL